MSLALALDIGGTKLAAGLVGADGALDRVEQVATPDTVDGDELFAAVAALLDRVVGTAQPEVLGVGCGGPMIGAGDAVSPLNIPAWRGFPLRERLAAATGLPTHVDNDAKALALGEGWQGGARGAAHYVAMVVSTGVGGGIVLDGRLLDGAHGNAGHIGHVVVEPEGRPCACGSRGCLEAEVSGTAIAAITGRPAAEAPPELRERTGRLVGRAVASLVALLDLPLALVAGSVALGFGDEFFVPAQDELDRTARIEHARGAALRPAGLRAEGPLVGAAAVGLRGIGRDVGVR
jgi:glucokinase